VSHLGLDWFAALNLEERCVAAPPRAHGVSASVESWRAGRPFGGHPEIWSARLRELGIDEEQLAGLAGESLEALRARVPAPLWLVRMDAALRDAGPLDPAVDRAARDAKTNHARGCLRLVTPWARAGLPALRAALAEAKRHGVALDAEAVLQSLLDHLPSLVSAALTRTLALEVHVARSRGLLQGDTPEARFDFFVDAVSDPEVLPSFWERHPVAARHVSQVVASYVEFSTALLAHLAQDWAELLASLLQAADGKLVAIVAHDSETHRNGKIVTTLRFESEKRVLYKPRSAEIDLAYAQALAFVAERAPGLPVPRSPRVVSRVDRSYHELIAARSCDDHGELARYFERQGVHLALLYVLVAHDMHADNQIAAGEHPVLVDLEAVLQPRATRPTIAPNPAADAAASSVLAPLFLPQKLAATSDVPGVDITALGARTGQRSPIKSVVMVEIGTDDVRATYEREAVTAPGRPGIDGADADAGAWVDEIVSGFAQAWKILEAHKEEFISGPLAALRDAPVRVLLRPTDLYWAILRTSFHPSNLADGVSRDRVYDLLYGAAVEEPGLLPVIASERADLHQGDVPFFSMLPSTRDLVDSRGAVIRDFFDEPPYDEAKRRVRALSDDRLRQQTWLIRASFATMTMGKGDGTWAPSNAALPPVPVTREGLLDRASAIGDRLARLALREGDRVGWLGLELIRERDWVLVPASVDLYGGAPGIALFLAYLGAATHKSAFTELAKAAVATTVPELAAKLASHRPVSIGMGGAGGAIFALAHMAALWEEEALLVQAEGFARALARHVADDTELDVLEGAAGCALAMLALDRARPSDTAREIARGCAQRLREGARTTEAEGTAWPTASFKLPLGGYAHGASGIAVALLRLREALGEEAGPGLETLARGALAFERTLFDPATGNWRDLRPAAEGKFMTTWCHGAPGIGLARLDAAPHLGPSVLEDVASAVRATTASGFGLNHSLCHGDFGNLELLWRAEAAGDRLGRLCASLDAEGPVCGVPGGLETPGLFAGLAGIGWQLLRFADPTRIPSLLSCEPPRGPARVP
jgi:type 2 lantibiotic biosynthesis protein LanM